MRRILLTIAMVIFFFGVARATDYYVDANNGSNTTGDGSQAKPWMTISFALAQVSGTGHTINVVPGTYDNVMDGVWFEVFPLIMKNGVSLVGADSANTMIDPKGTATAIRGENIDNSTKIENFKIINGYGTLENDGGGIYLKNSQAKIINNVIRDCNGRVGDGIYCENSSVTIIGNSILNNNGNDAGGINLRYSDGAVIKNNLIADNKGGAGGINCDGSDALIEDNQILRNIGTTNWSSGAIRCESNSTAIIRNNVIIGNDDGWGGEASAIFCWGSAPLIEKNIIANNVGGDGVITCLPGSFGAAASAIIQFNTITGNTTDAITLKAYSSDPLENVVVSNNIMSNNTGFGIRETATNADPQIVSYNLFFNNSDGHYYNENTQAYTTVAMMDAMVAECNNNLEGDPLFVDEPNGDYHLLPGSPAIDAGDPNSPLDPDGTRADIGAFYSFDPSLPPMTPRNLKAIAGDAKVTLIWSANLEPDFAYYTIYRSETSGFIPSPSDSIAKVEKPDSIYIDTSVTNDIAYYYRLCAVDSLGMRSDYTTQVSATPHVEVTTHYYVDDSGVNEPGRGTQSNPWKTITYALSQISLVGADYAVIHVSPGIYSQALGETFPVQVKNKISLIGADATSTILDAGGSESVLKCVGVSDSTTHIEGFTIQNGSNSSGGGGIFITAGSHPVITTNIIKNNKVPVSRVSTSPESRLGGGIYVLNSSPKIIDNQIVDNWTGATSIYKTGSGGWGGGIAVSGSASNPIIKNNTITGNRAINTSFASAYGGGIYVGDGALATIVSNTISGNSLRQLSATSGLTRGGGIYFAGSGATITNNVILNNTASAMYGSVSACGGIFIDSSSPSITNNVMAGNDFGGISLSSSSPQIINNTIAYNEEDGVLLSNSSSPILVNNILAFNSIYGIRELSFNDDPSTVSYNLFYYNESGLYFNEGNSSYFNAGDLNTSVPECSYNLDGDPLFIDALNGDYHLRVGSPAIDAGHPDPQYNDTDGSRNDIGAYGGPGIITEVEKGPNNSIIIPSNSYLFQNYPNPFNPETTIKYQLPKNSEVILRIYNVVGQLIRTLVDEKKVAGYYSIHWDGKDNSGSNVASGIYIYRIETKEFTDVRKMVLVR